MHKSVLPEEVLGFFEGQKIGRFMDGTVGAGGHAQLILKAHPEIETFYAVDRDESALELAKQTLSGFSNVEYCHANFADFEIGDLDGILLDVGVSSMQLDQGERGFSFMRPGPLDMRMDQTERLTAMEVVNRYGEKRLGEIFRDYGEEKRWRRAAAAIVEARRKKRIETTADLVEVLKPVLGWQRKHFNPMTLIFQALRIEVNGELVSLEQGILRAVYALNPGGRLAVISFHSLEDRIVKHTFLKLKVEEKSVHLLTKKPVVPKEEEAKVNPRARSAKLRVVEKV